MSHKVLDYSWRTGWRPGDDPSHVKPTIPDGKVWHHDTGAATGQPLRAGPAFWPGLPDLATWP
jgi:hypothetical protein